MILDPQSSGAPHTSDTRRSPGVDLRASGVRGTLACTTAEVVSTVLRSEALSPYCTLTPIVCPTTELVWVVEVVTGLREEEEAGGGSHCQP